MLRYVLTAALTLLLLNPGFALAQVDEPPPPPPLGDVDDDDTPDPKPRASRRAQRQAVKKAAEEPAEPDGSPVVRAKDGNMGMFFNFGGLGTMSTTGDSVYRSPGVINTQVGIKFVFNENMMLPIYFGMGMALTAKDDSESATDFSMDFGAGFEYHFRIWRRISPFFGALLKFGFSEPHSEKDESQLVFSFIIGPTFGVEYYIGDRVSLAAQYLFLFEVGRSSASDTTTFSMATKSGGQMTITYYF